MDIKINQLKAEFTEIIDLRSKALSGFDKLKTRINILKGIYAEYIKNNKQTLYLFGLDSFHFQGQLIDIEHNDLMRYFLAISNRIYCEYYKLYKIIVEFMNENMKELNIMDPMKIDEKLPVYRDVEPFKQYEFEKVIDIHNHIIVLLNFLFTDISNKKHQLKNHLFKNHGGLNTDNFVLTFKYNILILKNKTEMFMGYLSFFHKLHIKYLTRANERANHINNTVTTDINFENIMTNDITKPDDSDTDSDSDDGNGGGNGGSGGGNGGSGGGNGGSGGGNGGSGGDNGGSGGDNGGSGGDNGGLEKELMQPEICFGEPKYETEKKEEISEALSTGKESEKSVNAYQSEADEKSIASSITTSSKNENNKQTFAIKPKMKKFQITKEDINKIKKIDTFFQSKPLVSDESSNISIKIEETEKGEKEELSVNSEEVVLQNEDQTINESKEEEAETKEENALDESNEESESKEEGTESKEEDYGSNNNPEE